MLYACNCRMGWNARKAAKQEKEREGAGIIIVVIIIIDTPLDMVGSGKRRDERGRESREWNRFRPSMAVLDPNVVCCFANIAITLDSRRAKQYRDRLKSVLQVS